MRYLPKSPVERQGMLAAIGAKSINELFSSIPEKYRLREALNCDWESYRVSLEVGDLMGQAHALNNMSQVEREMGQREEALAHVRSAVDLFPQTFHIESVAVLSRM